MSVKARLKDLAWSAYVWPKGEVGNRAQAAVLRRVESRRVRAAWESAERVLLVHTPGKVGSKAIVAALKAASRPGDVIFHTHRINPDSLRGVEEERRGVAPRRTWYTADFLGKRLREPHDKDVVVIAAVRDPVARGLSAFMQNIERHGEARRPITSLTRQDAVDLGRQFVERYPHQEITTWVEVELNDMFGVDLYLEPFDHATGYQVVRRDRLAVGVVRHDRLGTALRPFLRDLAGLAVPEVGRVNDSSGKAYADVYADLRASLTLPQPLLDLLYDSAYARHFFTDEERRAAVERWSAVPDGKRA